MADQQSNHFGMDSNEFLKNSVPQRFARKDVIVHQSISFDERVSEARKILKSGGSLFLEQQKRNHK